MGFVKDGTKGLEAYNPRPDYALYDFASFAGCDAA